MRAEGYVLLSFGIFSKPFMTSGLNVSCYQPPQNCIVHLLCKKTISAFTAGFHKPISVTLCFMALLSHNLITEAE